MKTDVLIIGAGPAGIFTALELLRQGSKKKIMIVEKGVSIEYFPYTKGISTSDIKEKMKNQ